MKTSKFFFSTLIAASAMTATAYADYTFSSSETVAIASDTEHASVIVNEGITGTFDITTNNADLKIGSLTLNGDLVVNEPTCALGEIGNISGTGSITLSKTTANNWGGALVLSGESSGYTGTINIWNGQNSTNNPGQYSQFLILKSENAAGSAKVFLGAATVLTVATETTNIGGLSSENTSATVVSQASSYGYGANPNPYNNSYDGNNPSNDATRRTLNITGSGTYEYKGVFGSSSNIESLSLNWSGTGTQIFSHNTYVNDLTVSAGKLSLKGETSIAGNVSVTGGSLELTGTNTAIAGTVSNGGTLTLGGTVSLSSAITNTGEVTLNDGVIFDLGTFNFVDGSNAVISGGTITSGLTEANFQNIGVMRGGSFTVSSTESALSISLTSGQAGTITWNGSGSGVWNMSTDSTVWTMSGENTSFYFKDNVVFGAEAENKTVTLEAGKTVTVGTATISGGNYTFASNTGGTASLVGSVLTIESGASLTVGDQGNNTSKHVSIDFDSISVAGTLNFNTIGSNSWSSLTFEDGGKLHFVDGQPGITNLSVDTVTLNGSTTISAAADKNFAIGTLSGSGSLSITGSSAWGALGISIGDLSGYTGDMTITGGNSGAVVSAKMNQISNKKVSVGNNATLTLIQDSNSNANTVDLSSVSGNGTLSLKLFSNANGDGVDLSNFEGTIEVGKADAAAQGRLLLSSSTLNSASAIKVLSGGQLVFDGDGTNISNDIVFSADSTIHANNGKSGTLSGAISATGTITKAGAGVLTLTGEANIAKINVSSGTLNVGDGGVLTVTGDSNNGSDITGTLNVIGGGTLKFAGHDALGYSNRNASGLVVAQGASSEKLATILFADTGSFTLSKEIQLKGNTLVKNADGNSNSIKALGGQFTASGTNNTISSALFMTEGKVDFSVDKGGALTVDGAISGSNSWDKLGEGVLTLSGANSAYTGTISVAGTLVAASTSALGSGNVSVANGAKLQISVENVDAGTINLASGATLVVDLADFADVLVADNEMLTILTGTTLTFGDVSAASDTLTTEQLGYLSVTDSSGAFSKYVNKEWSYSDGTLSLTLTIPEPSAFGLLAGVGALALVVSRRRRSRR